MNSTALDDLRQVRSAADVPAVNAAAVQAIETLAQFADFGLVPDEVVSRLRILASQVRRTRQRLHQENGA